MIKLYELKEGRFEQTYIDYTIHDIMIGPFVIKFENNGLEICFAGDNDELFAKLKEKNIVTFHMAKLVDHIIYHSIDRGNSIKDKIIRMTIKEVVCFLKNKPVDKVLI